MRVHQVFYGKTNDMINFELDKIEDINPKFITQSEQFYGTYFIFSKGYYEIFF